MKNHVSQPSLFGSANDEAKKKGDDFLINQLVKLGDMMGDGLHHESDGKWIEQEYRKISKVLFPEQFNTIRRKKAAAIDMAVAAAIAEKKCECGGHLRQTRKGANKIECVACNKIYKLKKAKQ